MVASGGTGTLVISGDATTNLLAGTYNYTVTDANGCLKTVQAIINVAPSALVFTASATQISCFGGTGSVALAASGGTGTLVMSGNATTNLLAGTYNYTVTDAIGCTANASAIINVAPSALVFTATATQISCFGGTGSVALAAVGGTGTLVITGSAISNLIAGTYNYTVTDANGCTANASAIINAAPSALVFTATATQISCFGGTGSVALVSSGGTGIHTITGDSTTNLLAGTYNYTVTDANGCLKTVQAIINSAPPALTFTATPTQINCFGGTGSVALAASGGIGTLVISGDATTNLIAGTYNYTVTDATGCTANASAIINAAPSVLVCTASATQIPCFGGTGSVVLTSSGGTGARIITGDSTTNLLVGIYNYIITDANSCSKAVQATINPAPPALTLTATVTQIACFGGTGSVGLAIGGGTGTRIITGDPTTNLVAGTYNYLVTDANGCTASAQAIINVAPGLVTVTLIATQITCFGSSDGIITAIGNGGISPFYFSWQNGDTTATTTGLAIGTYSVAVSDSMGCLSSSSVIIFQPPLISLSGSTVASTCNYSNGSATVTASGGTGTYYYSWSPSGGTSSIATNLLADDYMVTVTDANACQQQMSLTVASASFLIANFDATDVCFNDSTTFTNSSMASPGSSITSWEWNFGNFSPLNYSQNPTYVYPAPGTYNVSLTVTSTNGCTSTLIKPVMIHFLPLANFSNTKVCLNASTLFTDLSSVAGGDSIDSWLWNFADFSASETIQNPSHTYSLPGTFNASLLVTTNYGCIDTVTMPTIVYTPPSVHFIVNDSNGCINHCPQFTDTSDPLIGTITNWQWNFGDGSPFGTNSGAEHCYTNSGSYTVSLTATASNGCSATSTQTNLINVYQAPVAEFDYSTLDPSIASSEVYFGNLSVGSSAWSWHFGDVNDPTGSSLEFPSHNYSEAGNYCITLVAENNFQCTDSVVHCLNVDPEFTFFIPNAFTPNESEGTNDRFSGYGTNIIKYDMWIFDRWGDMIFHTEDLKIGWDGKANKGKEIAQRSVYVYLVELKDFRGGEHTYRGTVTLVR